MESQNSATQNMYGTGEASNDEIQLGQLLDSFMMAIQNKDLNKIMENPNKKHGGEITPRSIDEITEVSAHEQVRREFEAAADHGEPESEQLKNEFGEPHYMLPSPMNSWEDAAFTNINPDQMGESVGVNNQRNQPLEIIENIEARDENRWALNPASAEDFDK